MRKLLLLTVTIFFLFSFLTTNGQTNPAVTINQPAVQPDPTSLQPINFTVVFDQPVLGFTTGDVVITGTAASVGIATVVTGGPTLYNVSVVGMISCGTIIANIPAGVCTNSLTQPNLASTSLDNTVTYLPLLPNPNVTINQAATQPDPTLASPINFTVVFDQAVTGFATGNVSLSGTAGATTAIVTGSGSTYNVAVSGMTASGTVIASIAAGVCTNACTQANNASTSTDNTVTISCVPPVVTVTPAFACGGITGVYGVPLTASAQPAGPTYTYTWSQVAGLFTNQTTTAPYTGTNLATVYAAPTAYTVYTVTATNTATGCSNTATVMVNYTPPAPVITPASAIMCIGDPAVKLKVTSGLIPASPAIWSPISGLYRDQSGTLPYLGSAVDSVWARPTPASSYMYQAGAYGMPAPTLSFTNPAAITIPVGGMATAYPANLTVSGVPSNATIRSIVLNGVNHSRSADIDIILQSPTGQNVILMSDVGGTNAVNATYTLTDAAVIAMSATAANPTGTYKPTNAVGALEPDNFPAPGPGAVSQPSPTIGFFTGSYNGTWKLFVVDDDGTSDQGVISGGYTINFDMGLQGCYSPPRNVVVNVVNPVTITTQPANQALCTGSIVATFTVSVAGAGPASFQWQVSTDGGTAWNNVPNGGIYSGGTTATLTIVPVNAGMSGYLYRLLINGGTGCSVTSNAGLLTINPLPTAVITANPLVIGPTQTSTISSTVTANPAATYAWYLNGSILPGETAATLLVNYGSPGDYQLKVTNACGAGLSNIVTIANSFALNMFTYPNPSGGIFQLRYTSPVNTTVQRSLVIYNNQGDKIITKNFTQTIPYQKVDVDVRAHGKGIYWVELKDGYGRRLAMNRVVVQ